MAEQLQSAEHKLRRDPPPQKLTFCGCSGPGLGLGRMVGGMVYGWHLFLWVRFVGGLSTAIIFVLGTALTTQVMP